MQAETFLNQGNTERAQRTPLTERDLVFIYID
jgi:hypothetical protein